MSTSQLYHVKYPALSTALQDSGPPSNFQIEIFSGPSSHRGLSNGKLYVTQGHKHICALTNLGSQATLQTNISDTPLRRKNWKLGAEALYSKITYIYWKSASLHIGSPKPGN